MIMNSSNTDPGVVSFWFELSSGYSMVFDSNTYQWRLVDRMWNTRLTSTDLKTWIEV